MPTPEGLAAFKYAAMVRPARGRPERMQDAVDLTRLVLREAFDSDKLLAYMVGPFEAQHREVRQRIDDIRSGRPIQI